MDWKNALQRHRQSEYSFGVYAKRTESGRTGLRTSWRERFKPGLLQRSQCTLRFSMSVLRVGEPAKSSTGSVSEIVPTKVMPRDADRPELGYWYEDFGRRLSMAMPM